MAVRVNSFSDLMKRSTKGSFINNITVNVDNYAIVKMSITIIRQKKTNTKLIEDFIKRT